jgi:hypothetical protein
VRCDNLGLKCSMVVNSVGQATSGHTALSRNVRPIQRKSGSSCLTSEDSQGVLLPAYSLRKDFVLLYFQYVHDKHHSLFHQPSVEVELENGKVPDVLLYAMMALGAR